MLLLTIAFAVPLLLACGQSEPDSSSLSRRRPPKNSKQHVEAEADLQRPIEPLARDVQRPVEPLTPELQGPVDPLTPEDLIRMDTFLDTLDTSNLILRAKEARANITRKTMGFSECLRQIGAVSEQLAIVPRNTVETTDLRMVRFPTPDDPKYRGVLITCSRPDRRMVIQKQAR